MTTLALSVAALSAVPLGAEALPQAEAQPSNTSAASGNPFAAFTPTATPVRHRIDYDIWDFALKQLVVSMGPSTRQTARAPDNPIGTRVRQGHNSRYRLEGSMLGFYFLDDRAITSFGEYRRELESVADTLDISTLPRNEQLAFWFNLHNVAMVEKIAENWPMRQPRRFMIDGVPLDEARFLTVRGVAMSLRDIRERIVYANWRDPKVIYGFWRGEIGSPALERNAFTGGNVSSLLALKAEEFVNSLRGTQKRGKTLDVATLYDEVSAFYFPNFETDIRAHIAEYAGEDVTKILAKTTQTQASIREWDIADLNGGRRDSIALVNSSAGVPASIGLLLLQRRRKLELMERKEQRTGRVFFTELVLPGADPNAGQVD